MASECPCYGRSTVADVDVRVHRRDWESILARTKQLAEENAKLTKRCHALESLLAASGKKRKQHHASTSGDAQANEDEQHVHRHHDCPAKPRQEVPRPPTVHEANLAKRGAKRLAKIARQREARKRETHSSGNNRGNKDHGKIVRL
jgi:hypothetical protein